MFGYEVDKLFKILIKTSNVMVKLRMRNGARVVVVTLGVVNLKVPSRDSFLYKNVSMFLE